MSTNIYSIIKFHLAGRYHFLSFVTAFFKTMYDGASVLMLASVTDVTDVMNDEKNKIW